MISLIIPATSSNQRYTDFAIQQIRELYPNEDEVEIVVEINDDVTLGINYNNAVAKAKGEKIILLHNDMVIKPGFIEQMDKNIVKGRITAYTRVEPPIFPNEFPGKKVVDCGFDLNSFNYQKFLDIKIEHDLLEPVDPFGGAQLFFGCMKEDYLGIDGYTFKLFCEDDDLHLRHKIAGFEQKVSCAHVYHFVSKTSRVGNYQQIENESNINFIKKWGFRKSQHNVVYNKKITINGLISPENKKNIEYWFNGGDDIIVEIDDNFNEDDYNYIQQLNDIVKQTNDIGTFELGNLTITVNSLEEQQNKLIYL